MDYMDFLDFKSSQKANREPEHKVDKEGLQQVKELYHDTAKDIDAKREKIFRPLRVMEDADDWQKHTSKYLEDKDNISADIKENKEDAAYRRALNDILGKVIDINEKLRED